MIIDDLEIIIITYNRIKYLKNTLSQLFSNNSPIKDFKFTILDNKSNDGSSELIQKYVNKYPNIKYIIHNRNIGGNANITRAFEIATKKYVWVLCDDDEYDWTHWNTVEKAVKENYDAILVANYINPQKNTAQLLKQMTFMPSTIYKTEVITTTALVNAEFGISNMFPHLTFACKLINDNKKIKILDNWIVNMVPHGGYETYTRGLNEDIHPYLNQTFWQIGFLNTVQLIKDTKLRTYIIDNMHLENGNLLSNFIQLLKTNKFDFNNSLKNIFDAFCALNFRQKIVFIIALLCSFFILLSDKDKDKLKIQMTLANWNFKTKINFQKFIKKNKNKKICLYGGGLFATKFLENFDLSSLNILGIIDKNEEKRGSKICGYKVYSIEDLEILSPEDLVLTVLEKKHCLPSLEKLKTSKGYKFNILHLYSILNS